MINISLLFWTNQAAFQHFLETGFCMSISVCAHVWTCACRDTCSTHAVPFCVPAAIVLVIVYHFLPIFFVYFSLSLPLLFPRFFSIIIFYFFTFSLCVGGVARSCPNAPPTSVTSRLALVQSDQLLVKGVNETLVAQRVVPALITLSSDPEM